MDNGNTHTNGVGNQQEARQGHTRSDGGSDILTLQQIIERDFPEPPPLIDHLLCPGEVVLFFARQKEGKSTLALQFAIDMACGDPFLGRYKTAQGRVLYVDYENRFHALKKRGIDLARDRRVENLHIKAFEKISHRDVGLFGKECDRLKGCVKELQPSLLIIDPLRYAMSRGRQTAKEEAALEVIDQISRLYEVSPPHMGVVLVHHAKRPQGQIIKARLLTDARGWIEEQVYGSQALLAHVDNIWGLEEEGDGHVFATVPRAQEPLSLRLEKQPDSERFLLGTVDEAIFTDKQREVWEKLPREFGWREGIALGIHSQTLNRVVRTAMTHGLLMQDPKSKKYKKVGSEK